MLTRTAFVARGIAANTDQDRTPVQSQSDEQLMAQVMGGEREALACLVERHHSPLTPICTACWRETTHWRKTSPRRLSSELFSSALIIPSEEAVAVEPTPEDVYLLKMAS
jgi:hypothetical protein